jgi:hypothetical protein
MRNGKTSKRVVTVLAAGALGAGAAVGVAACGDDDGSGDTSSVEQVTTLETSGNDPASGTTTEDNGGTTTEDNGGTTTESGDDSGGGNGGSGSSGSGGGY